MRKSFSLEIFFSADNFVYFESSLSPNKHSYGMGSSIEQVNFLCQSWAKILSYIKEKILHILNNTMDIIAKFILI